MAITQNNFLTSTGWSVSLESANFPNLNCSILKFNHPSIEVASAKQISPKYNIPRSGSKYKFDQLKLTAILESDLTAYETIFNWLTKEVETPDNPFRDKTEDIQLLLYNSKANLTKTITFFSAFPVSLGGFSLDTTNKNDSYLTFDITMEYSNFKID